MNAQKRKKVEAQKKQGINGVTFRMIIDAIEKASKKNKEFLRNKFVLEKNPNATVDKASVFSGLMREEVVLIHGSGLTFKDRGTASIFKTDRKLKDILKKLQEVGRLRGTGALKF